MHIAVFSPHESYHNPQPLDDSFISTLREICGDEQVKIDWDVHRETEKMIFPKTEYRLYLRKHSESAVVLHLEALLAYFLVEKASRRRPRSFMNARNQVMESFARCFELKTKRINCASERDLLDLLQTTPIANPTVFFTNDMTAGKLHREYPATVEMITNRGVPIISCPDEGPVRAAKLALAHIRRQVRDGLPNSDRKEM